MRAPVINAMSLGSRYEQAHEQDILYRCKTEVAVSFVSIADVDVANVLRQYCNEMMHLKSLW